VDHLEVQEHLERQEELDHLVLQELQELVGRMVLEYLV